MCHKMPKYGPPSIGIKKETQIISIILKVFWWCVVCSKLDSDPQVADAIASSSRSASLANNLCWVMTASAKIWFSKASFQERRKKRDSYTKQECEYKTKSTAQATQSDCTSYVKHCWLFSHTLWLDTSTIQTSHGSWQDWAFPVIPVPELISIFKEKRGIRSTTYRPKQNSVSLKVRTSTTHSPREQCASRKM